MNRDNNPPAYLKHHQKLLTQEKELELFDTWNKNKGTKLGDYYLTEIIKRYSPIVLSAAKKLSGYNLNQEDLISEGTLGLIQAAHRFQPELGYRFATYCWSWVQGLLFSYVASNFFVTNVTSTPGMKKLFYNLRRVMKEESDEGTAPTGLIDKIAERLGVSAEETAVMYHLLKQPYESLSTPIKGYDDEEMTYENTVCDDPNPEDTIIRNILAGRHQKLIRDAIERVLNPREKEIFLARILPGDSDVKTLDEIGSEMKLSKERIRQIQDIAIKKVRSEILRRVPVRARRDMFM